jgi:hypothetical protein
VRSAASLLMRLSNGYIDRRHLMERDGSGVSALLGLVGFAVCAHLLDDASGDWCGRWRRPRTGRGAGPVVCGRSGTVVAGWWSGTCPWRIGRWCRCGPSDCGAVEMTLIRGATRRRAAMLRIFGKGRMPPHSHPSPDEPQVLAGACHKDLSLRPALALSGRGRRGGSGGMWRAGRVARGRGRPGPRPVAGGGWCGRRPGRPRTGSRRRGRRAGRRGRARRR